MAIDWAKVSERFLLRVRGPRGDKTLRCQRDQFPLTVVLDDVVAESEGRGVEFECEFDEGALVAYEAADKRVGTLARDQEQSVWNIAGCVIEVTRERGRPVRRRWPLNYIELRCEEEALRCDREGKRATLFVLRDASLDECLALSQLLRASDLVGFGAESQVAVALLPDTSAAQSHIALSRIQKVSWGMGARLQTYSYPEHDDDWAAWWSRTKRGVESELLHWIVDAVRSESATQLFVHAPALSIFTGEFGCGASLLGGACIEKLIDSKLVSSRVDLMPEWPTDFEPQPRTAYWIGQADQLTPEQQLNVLDAADACSKVGSYLIGTATHSALSAVFGRDLRRDYLTRLQAARIDVAPLRENEALLSALLEKLNFESSPAGEQARQCLQHYPWPGNLVEFDELARQLGAQSCQIEVLPAKMREGFFAARGRYSRRSPAVSGWAKAGSSKAPDLRVERRALEREKIAEALAACDGNQSKAAGLLGISRRTLITRLEEFGFPRPRKKRREKGTLSGEDIVP